MPQSLQIVGIGGSLAAQSSSLAALRYALDGAEAAGAQTQLFSIRSLDLPLYNPDIEDAPQAAREMVDAVYAAHGLIWSSPLYQGTISGAFKNALDWLQLLSDREPAFLTNKVVGLISTAGGVQGLQAINTMEFAVRALRGWAVPLVLPIPRAWQTFDEHGQVRDQHTADQLQALGREVVRAAAQFADNGQCDYTER